MRKRNSLFVPFVLFTIVIANSYPYLAASNASDTSAYEKAFQKRADFYIRRTADRDLDHMTGQFDSIGYFRGSGGDRHKYAMGPIIAKLALNPKDEQALRAYRMLMAVDKQKGDRGIYHFSAFQKTRMYFQLKEVLPQDILNAHEYDVRNFYDVMRRGGTENHQFMNRCSGYVWAENLAGPFPGAKDGREDSLAWQRNWLEEQTERFYNVGNGEYDSSTYVAFSIASWSNVYDFAKDPVMRDVARAAMDWLAVAMARKYFHGCSLGPEARGFARVPVGQIQEQPSSFGTAHMAYQSVGAHTDWLGWLWWGDTDGNMMVDRGDVEVDRFPSLNLALSRYRPHPVIRNIATKNVALPYEARGSKPAYYGNEGNKDHEYLYIDEPFAMGTLYSPEKGVRTSGTILPQTTMFKLLVRSDRGLFAFGMANGYHRHFPLEGRTPYDQYHQQRGSAINICYVNAEEDKRTFHRCLFGYPEGAGDPKKQGAWYFWNLKEVWLAVRALNGKAILVSEDTLRGHSKQQGYRYLVSPGKLGGWVVQVGRQKGLGANDGDKTPAYADYEAFVQAVTERCSLDLSQFDPEQRTVSFTNDRGVALSIRHTGGPGGRPEAWANGKQLVFENWPVFDSPYVKQESGSGKLWLSDGRQMLTIHFNEGKPVFAETSAY